MPIDAQTANFAAPAIITGETASQYATRIRERNAIRARFAVAHRAIAHLEALGIQIRSIEMRGTVPTIEVAPSWRLGALGPAIPLKTTQDRRVCRVPDVRGCRIEWVEPVIHA